MYLVSDKSDTIEHRGRTGLSNQWFYVNGYAYKNNFYALPPSTHKNSRYIYIYMCTYLWMYVRTRDFRT